MRARRSRLEVSLVTLRETVELARAIADNLPTEASPSYSELMEALSCAHIALLRLAVERARTSARPVDF